MKAPIVIKHLYHSVIFVKINYLYKSWKVLSAFLGLLQEVAFLGFLASFPVLLKRSKVTARKRFCKYQPNTCSQPCNNHGLLRVASSALVYHFSNSYLYLFLFILIVLCTHRLFDLAFLAKRRNFTSLILITLCDS